MTTAKTSIVSVPQPPRRAVPVATWAAVVLLAATGCGQSAPQPAGIPGGTAAGATPAISTGTDAGTTDGSTEGSTDSGTTTTVTSTQTSTMTSTKTATSTVTSAGTVVVASRIAHSWTWPNTVAGGVRVTHRQQVPPVPQLIRIAAGNHPANAGQPPFQRLSFTFTQGFPSYRFEFTHGLISDPAGTAVPLRGLSTLTVVFSQAQAHTVSVPVRSSIIARPARPLGFSRLVDYAPAGDVEGVVTYGLGVTYPARESNPQFGVRAVEVETVSPSGQHLYVVAIDIDASNPVAP